MSWLMRLTTRQVLFLLAGTAAGSVLLEFAIRHEDHGAWWHAVAGLDLAIGFVGCIVLVWAAKALGALGLQRPEDEHPEDEP